MSRANLWLSLAAVAALAAGLLVAALMKQPSTGPGSIESGVLLDKPRAITPFQLTGSDSQPFTNERFAGQWSLLFPGFTHCPDICPNTMGVLKAVKSKLDEEGRPLQVVFLSVDPERDTPDALRQYVQYFNPAFVGVTGPTEELDKLVRSLSIVYGKAEGDTPGSYTIDHSSALVLINPQGLVAGYFTPPFKAEVLSRDLATVIGSSS